LSALVDMCRSAKNFIKAYYENYEEK